MTNTVGELVEKARALSEGEFEQEFQQHFQGELGQLASYLEAIRQTLQSLSTAANDSKDLLPKAADGVAEINREAESGFNSVWEVVEQMQSDQATARELLGAEGVNLTEGNIGTLRGIVEKNRESLIALMSYLSFQDVLRQRLEKVQHTIAQMEARTLDLIVKFKVKNNEKSLDNADGAALDQAADLDQNLVDQLLATLR